MLLDVQHLSKAYSGEDILTDVSFHMEEREKAAVVGINGAGKTTLLRMITKEEEPDRGTVVLSRGSTVGYLAQHQEYSEGGSIYHAVFEVNRELLSLWDRMKAAEALMPALSGEDLRSKMEEYARLSEAFERQSGYAYRSEVVGILKGLGFEEERFDDDASTLSGGQKTRLSLARILLSRPDFLILDEPTNHLDMRSVAWLETYLLSYPGAVLVVSHDRYFLNRFVTKIIEIENKVSSVYRGNYDAYTEKKEMLRKAQLRAYFNAQRKIAHEEAVIEKLRSFNREKSIKRAESREKKLTRIDMPDRPFEEDTDMHLLLTPSKESGKDVLTAEGLTKAFDDHLLFSDLAFLIRKGERVALIGDNGTGKSTMLKIINGLIAPDAGEIRLGANVEIGYYDQENQLLHMEKTIFEEISDEWPDMNNTRIRSVLAAFLFTGEDVFKRIGDLSGGERARVSLARLMLSNANFLILDEPTNHLDIHSRAILENALRNYAGTLFFVSHDRYFINRTATRIFELSGQSVKEYGGDYSYYLEKKAEEEVTDSASMPKESSESAEKIRWQEQKSREAARRKTENRLKRLEEEIAHLEEEIDRINTAFSDPAIGSDPAHLIELTKEQDSYKEALDRAYEEWEELMESG